MILWTDRLALRPLQPEDAAPFFDIFRDPDNIRFWFTPDRTLEETRARIARAQAVWGRLGFGDWAVVEKSTGRFIGFCGLHHISGMAEVNLGYLLKREVWGRGYATEACRAALDFGFKKAGLPLIVGVPHPDNAASINVPRKCGMTYWRDVEKNGVPRVVYSRQHTVSGHAAMMRNGRG